MAKLRIAFAAALVLAVGAVGRGAAEDAADGKALLEEAVQLQSLTHNGVQKALSSLKKPGLEAASKKELGNALEMQRLSFDKLGQALAIEGKREPQAAPADKKADAAKKAAAQEEAKQRHAQKLAAMEKLHESQRAAAGEIEAIQSSAAKREENLAKLEALEKKMAEIDQQVVALGR